MTLRLESLPEWDGQGHKTYDLLNEINNSVGRLVQFRESGNVLFTQPQPWCVLSTAEVGEITKFMKGLEKKHHAEKEL